MKNTPWIICLKSLKKYYKKIVIARSERSERRGNPADNLVIARSLSDEAIPLVKNLQLINTRLPRGYAARNDNGIINMALDIIKKTAEYLIINKPAGLIVHGAPHIKEVSLVDELIKKFPKIKKVGDDPARPGIVHRLDKLVSGLMLVARTAESFDNLKKQFQQRTVAKYYTALVYGRIEADEGKIDFPIYRSKGGYKMVALPKTVKREKNPLGREALSEYEIIKRYINYTLLKVRIKTGRTHQIRCHLAAFGHPVVGDDLYGTNKTKLKNQRLGLSRIFLHARVLEFDNLKGVRKKYKVEMPAELTELLNTKIK